MKQSNQTTAPALSSTQNCWFCNSQSKPSSSLKLQFRKSFITIHQNDNSSDPLYSIRVEFIDPYIVEIYIPRCGMCKTVQACVALGNKILLYATPILMLILFFINPIICVVVSLLLGLLYNKRKSLVKMLPAFVKRRLHNHAYQHPEAINLKGKGWFGNETDE